MLQVFFDSSLDSINKKLELTQALIKKSLQFFPGNGDVCFVFYFTLILLLAE